MLRTLNRWLNQSQSQFKLNHILHRVNNTKIIVLTRISCFVVAQTFAHIRTVNPGRSSALALATIPTHTLRSKFGAITRWWILSRHINSTVWISKYVRVAWHTIEVSQNARHFEVNKNGQKYWRWLHCNWSALGSWWSEVRNRGKVVQSRAWRFGDATFKAGDLRLLRKLVEFMSSLLGLGCLQD